MEDYVIAQPDNKKLSEILTELEMLRLLQKLNLEPSEIKEEEKVKATEISAEQKELDEQKLSELLKNENLDCLYRDNVLQIYEKSEMISALFIPRKTESIFQHLWQAMLKNILSGQSRCTSCVLRRINLLK